MYLTNAIDNVIDTQTHTRKWYFGFKRALHKKPFRYKILTWKFVLLLRQYGVISWFSFSFYISNKQIFLFSEPLITLIRFEHTKVRTRVVCCFRFRFHNFNLLTEKSKVMVRSNPRCNTTILILRHIRSAPNQIQRQFERSITLPIAISDWLWLNFWLHNLDLDLQKRNTWLNERKL